MMDPRNGAQYYERQHRPSGVGEDRNLERTLPKGSYTYSSTGPPGSVRIATIVRR